MLVRTQHDLPTIRIFLGRTGGSGRSEVVFQAVRGRGEPREIARCTTRDIGLPDAVPLAADRFELPGGVLSALARAAVDVAESHEMLWLELPTPRGYLYLAPWERMLAPLGRPLLRLPNHTLRPQASAAALKVALCVCAPPSAGFDPLASVDLAVGLWLSRSGHQVTVHVFTDADSYDGLVRRRADLDPAVVLHDPGVAYDSTAAANPWLRWISGSLEAGLDVVHCVTPGFLSGARGALALATLVGAAEMSAFLTSVGAWSTVLSGPPSGRHSGAALRELADAIAQVHPGVVLANEFATDPDGEQLGRAMAMVYGGTPVTDPLDAVTCWSHPLFVEYPPETREALLLTDDGRSTLIQRATHAALDRDDTPVWVSACTRFLEAQQARWLPDGADEPVDQDAVTALTAVSDLVERHVRRHVGGGS